ncbi:undecaprenyl-phosphate glucose phosphotransferase [Methylocaldum szegediense]|uniref:Colanic acid biosysnthesis UDP-glucose lipid carrier transferase n=1 Tax=Methylocaldum szegediense TaxID=73780 RepID=A0ABM9I6N0_9GAMM|nr:undecaprenyl-phosphate glucose phosphotransferase [Methylocaldum szegediense]CAI8925816.1 putative colanic acid biosysnthesis UDP-glucose lipid carrier transferase [Methylocaldum szegediense]
MPLSVGHVFRGLFKQYTHTAIVLLRYLDAAMLLVGGWIAYYLVIGSWNVDQYHRAVMAIGILAAIIFFEIGHIYRPWRHHAMASEVTRILTAWLRTLILVALLVTLIRQENWFESDYYWTAIWGVAGFLFVLVARLSLSLVLHWLRIHDNSPGRIILVGLNEMAIAASRHLNNSPWTRLKVIGYADDRSAPRFSVGEFALPRLGALKDLPTIISQEAIDEVWVAFPFKGEQRAEQVLHELRHLPVSIRLVIDCFAFKMSKFLNLNEVAGIPTLDISVSPLHGINRYIKEIEDRLLALILLILASPLMLLIAIGVKLSSPGPVFYRQERVGWNNRKFIMLKFRSMPVDAEAKTGPVWAKPGEKRATPFGAFLRRTSLDELPQLINVLKGEMSLVGPRPERPDFVEVFKDQVPNYMKKHMVKAGITGWAQVNGWRGDTDLVKRIEHDLYYIQNWSVWFDLEIILRTFVWGFVNKNAY